MIVIFDVLVDFFQHGVLFLNSSFCLFYQLRLEFPFSRREVALNFIAFEEPFIVYVTSIVDLYFLIVGLLLNHSVVPVIFVIYKILVLLPPLKLEKTSFEISAIVGLEAMNTSLYFCLRASNYLIQFLEQAKAAGSL